jgi:hypothetical protein
MPEDGFQILWAGSGSSWFSSSPPFVSGGRRCGGGGDGHQASSSIRPLFSFLSGCAIWCFSAASDGDCHGLPPRHRGGGWMDLAVKVKPLSISGVFSVQLVFC